MKNRKTGAAVLLPGIGYTCDKPLLYYSGKLARSLGWDVIPVPYTGFPGKIRGDRERMKQSFEIALRQTEDVLKAIDWRQYDPVVFISKSIGTMVAVRYADACGVPCRHVLFTPLEETFSAPVRDAVAFHGTADPWADTDQIRSLCKEAGIPLYITENANHSLETDDVLRNIRNLEDVMRQVKSFLTAGL